MPQFSLFRMSSIKPVERDLAIEVDALNRLVENHENSVNARSARAQEDTLELTTGQVAHLGICQMKNFGGRQCVFHLGFTGLVGQARKRFTDKGRVQLMLSFCGT